VKLRAFVATIGLLASLLASQPASAAEFSGGDITTDTTLQANGSGYTITQQIRVARGVTLTLAPGVTLSSALPSSMIQVGGNLLAQGSTNSPVTFLAAGTPFEFIEGTGSSVPSITLSHVVIAGGVKLLANTGIPYSNFSLTDSELVNQSCQGGTNDFSAQMAYQFTLERNVFQNTCGLSVEAYSSVLGGNRNVSINNNLFVNDAIGGASWLTLGSLRKDTYSVTGNEFRNTKVQVFGKAFFPTSISANSNFWPGLSLEAAQALARGKSSVFDTITISLDSILQSAPSVNPNQSNFVAAEAAKKAAEAAAKEAADKAAADVKAAADAAAKLAASKKLKTIVCVKGKATKKVTSQKPSCPSGFKLKK
jgi:hypothetical protein